MLVSTALNIDSAKTKEFACKVVIISSFRFPNYRKRLLTMLGYLIPSRYHVDTSLVDIVEYRVPENSVCFKYEELIPFTDDIDSALLDGNASHGGLSRLFGDSHERLSELLPLRLTTRHHSRPYSESFPESRKSS